jgi:hypothetical protein
LTERELPAVPERKVQGEGAEQIHENKFEPSQLKIGFDERRHENRNQQNGT